MSIYLQYPKMLFLLLLIPLMIFFHFFSFIRNKKAISFSNFGALERIYGINFISKRIVVIILDSLFVFLLVLVLSGITISSNIDSLYFSPLDFITGEDTGSFVICIDSSESMNAQDLYPNRLEVAKFSALRFINLIPSNVKVGVISFSGEVSVLQEISSSKLKINSAIHSIAISPIPGTNFYNAFITSSELLKNEDKKSIIIISDGQINVGELEDMIDYAKREKIIIHSVVVGTDEGSDFLEGVHSSVDESFLKTLSSATGGSFSRIKEKENTKEGLYQVISNLARGMNLNISNYLILFSILIFLLRWTIDTYRLRIIP